MQIDLKNNAICVKTIDLEDVRTESDSEKYMPNKRLLLITDGNGRIVKAYGGPLAEIKYNQIIEKN